MPTIARKPIDSDYIKSVGYDAYTGTLDIEFRQTGVYRYFSVPADIAAEMQSTPSPGKYHLQHIKSKYPWEKVGDL